MQDLFEMMNRAHALSEELSRRHDVTLQGLCLLWALSKAGGSMTMGELIAALERASATMTTTIDRAEKRAMVRRLYGQRDDRRIVVVELTAIGRQVLESALATVNAALAAAG